jgi:DNA-binding XRE family transcriptional regulator
MKGLRSIPRILRINHLDGYMVSCLFNNGESRLIDFATLFRDVFKVDKDDPAFPLLSDANEFNQIQLIGSTIGWPNVGIYTKDSRGQTVFYPYDLDPKVLYQNSTPDRDTNPEIGLMVKQARKDAGLTQEELAQKSGTSKHYISRLENNKADIELLTLKKIIEAGLGKRLQIAIK